VDVRLLDDGGQRLLGGAPRLEEGGKVTAPAQARDLQIDPPDTGVPGPPAIAVALHLPGGTTLPVRRASADLHLGLHQPLGRKTQHFAHQLGIGALLDQLQQSHSVVGHRRLRAWGSDSQPEP
jgi:hypothetical protein